MGPATEPLLATAAMVALFQPISSYSRGVASSSRTAANEEVRAIRSMLKPYFSVDLRNDVVPSTAGGMSSVR